MLLSFRGTDGRARAFDCLDECHGFVSGLYRTRFFSQKTRDSDLNSVFNIATSLVTSEHHFVS